MPSGRRKDKVKKKPDYVSYDGTIHDNIYSGSWIYNVAAKKAALKFEFKMRDAKEAFHPACREKSMILDFDSSESNVSERSPIFLGYSSKNCEKVQEGFPASTVLFEGYFEMSTKKNTAPIRIQEYFYASLDSTTTTNMNVKGQGKNRFGSFLLTGTYEAKTKSLNFRKTYRRRPNLKRSPITRRVQATIRNKKISNIDNGNSGLIEPELGRRRSSGRKRTSSSFYSRDLGYVSEEEKRRARQQRRRSSNESHRTEDLAVATPIQSSRTNRSTSTIEIIDFCDNFKSQACDICEGTDDSSQWGKLLRCSLCGVCVHSVCYGIQGHEISVLSLGQTKWMCSWCTKSGISASDRNVCVLCRHRGGALKETTDGRWVHLTCALWTPECAFVNPNRMEPVGCFDSKNQIVGFQNFPMSNFENEKCVICKTRGGSLLRCTNEVGCKSMMHPRCIQKEGLAMQASIDKRRFKFKLCCPTHANISNRNKRRSSSVEMEKFSESEGWIDATTLSGGDVFEGEMKRHRPHGRGTCIRMSSGHMYEGQWKSGKWHGQGILTDASDRVVYEGDFADGCPHGYGILHFRGSSSWYEGEFLNGQFHGKGTYVDGTGGWYSGEWRQGCRHGRGKYVKWPSIYEGGWNENNRDGRGVLWRADGLHYEGTFKSNMMDGRGTMVYPDGSRYVGTWKRGLREGRGTITFANDSTYEGHFREDKFDMTGNTGTFTLSKPMKREGTGERVIPVNMNQNLSRIHLRAGFTEHGT